MVSNLNVTDTDKNLGYTFIAVLCRTQKTIFWRTWANNSWTSRTSI